MGQLEVPNLASPPRRRRHVAKRAAAIMLREERRWPVAKIAAVLDVPVPILRRWFVVEAVENGGRRRRTRLFSAEEDARIVAWAAAGRTVATMARYLDRPHCSVKDRFARLKRLEGGERLRSYRPFSAEEDRILREMDGFSVRCMARALGRYSGAILYRQATMARDDEQNCADSTK